MTPGQTEEQVVPHDPDEYLDDLERGLQAQAETPVPAAEPSLLPTVAQKMEPEASKVGSDPKANRVVEIGEALLPAYQKASTLDVDPEAERLLRRMFPDEDIEQRPEGFLYIPHILVRERLCDAFGLGKWTMILRQKWIENKNGKETLHAEWVMVVNGVFIGETVTDEPLVGRKTYGEALEGTQGEAVRRIAGKQFMCGSQVWSPKYCREWLARRKASRTVQPPQPPSVATQPVKTPPAASQTPSQAAGVSHQAGEPHPETEVEKLTRWKKMLQPLNEFAVNWLRDNGKLLPNESLDDLTWVPSSRKEAGDVLDAIHQIMDIGCRPPCGPMDGLAPVAGADAGEEKPIEIKPNKDAEPWHEYEDDHGQVVRVPWRDLVVPLGKNRGAKFGDLPKEDLWWWCTKWQAKPWVGKDGKERPPSKQDVYLRRTLDKVKAHYGFKEGRT